MKSMTIRNAGLSRRRGQPRARLALLIVEDFLQHSGAHQLLLEHDLAELLLGLGAAAHVSELAAVRRARSTK